jgi:UDP-N-acetylmuramoyl-L-alanyl-D-glutamate--2,6-diaminopimelate ligase
MQVRELLKGVDIVGTKGNLDVEVSNLIYDSRKVVPGVAFVALKGARSDGHQYINEVIEKGAVVVFVEDEISTKSNATIVRIKDTRLGLAQLSANYFGQPAKKLTTIGITGTKGKTTTSWMIKNILETAGKKTGVIGTMGVFIGAKHYATNNTTPESYDIHKYLKEMQVADVEYVVMEVSSQALKMNRTAGIQFDYSIFTNLTKDHIGPDEHASMEEYIHCKSLLFRQSRHGIFNIDDAHFGEMADQATAVIHTYGTDLKADLRLEKIAYAQENGNLGVRVSLQGLVTDRIFVSIPGDFSAYNAMGAIAVTKLLGIDPAYIKKALSEVKVKGRVEPVNVSDQFTVLIDYAHNGVSMESVLEMIQGYHPKRIVSLFGCGGNRSRDRRYDMGEISGNMADYSILTADNSRYEDVHAIISDIVKGIEKTNGDYITISDRREAIKYSIQHALPGDIVLILGKGHEDYQEINGVRYPFDERVVIWEVVQELERERDAIAV